MNSNIQVYPEQQHFESVHEMVSEFQKFENFRRFHFENQSGFAAPKDKFEKIRLKDNSFFLVPTDAQFTLFRGENRLYENCRPAIYRTELNELEIFVNELKINEFYLLLNDYPVIQNIFKPEKFKIDYLGLAQHYGLKTDLLDFTSDINVALFFATCRYESTLDRYFPITGEGINTGYLYVYPFYKTITSIKDTLDFFCNKLQVIGLQPFERPAAQKGFSLKLLKQECLETFSYSFNYNKNDSKYFYEKYNQGDSLWVKDILADKTKLIKSSSSFSFDAFNLTIKSVGSKNKKGSYYQKLLNSNGFKLFQRKKLSWSFSNIEIESIAAHWDKTVSKQFWNSIVSRSMIVENVKYPEINIDLFVDFILLRTLMAEDNNIM